MLHNDLDGGQWAPTCVFLAAKCVTVIPLLCLFYAVFFSSTI